MAEEKAPSKIRGWIKAVLTSLMGLCSGAVLMYVSPLVTSTIKPAKPVANFSQHVQGLTVTFQNRAIGASEGWWDFGDGSPLEPFSASLEAVTHTYPHLGPYSAKLSLRNFVGEESDRSVPVVLEGEGVAIEAFKVEPLKRGSTTAGSVMTATAPATFKVVSQIKNADLCIWSLGDNRPLEVSRDTTPSQERYVTIRHPGFYTMRLVAVSGKQNVEKSQPVKVEAGTGKSPVANLQVTYQAVEVHHLDKEMTRHIAFPADRKEQAYPFTLTHVETDYKILDARLKKPANEAFVKNATLAISPDKSKVVLTGELVKAGGIAALPKNVPPLKWTPTIVLSLETRSEPVLKTFDPIATELTVPGTTILPLPKMTPRFEIKGTMLHLELLDGDKFVFKDSKLPAGAMIQFKNRDYRLTATQAPDHIRLDVIDPRATFRPIEN